jgi:hypothetical protein
MKSTGIPSGSRSEKQSGEPGIEDINTVGGINVGIHADGVN